MTGGLTFHSTSVNVLLSGVFILLSGIVCLVAWRRSSFAPGVSFLELLRWIIILLVILTLNQPEWLAQYRPDTKPTLAILRDVSASM